MTLCNICQTDINEADETPCPSLNYAIDTLCPWLPSDCKVAPAENGNPFVPGTDLAMAYDSGFEAGLADWQKEEEEDEARARRFREALAKGAL
jgi:hypothetical protein